MWDIWKVSFPTEGNFPVVRTYLPLSDKGRANPFEHLLIYILIYDTM